MRCQVRKGYVFAIYPRDSLQHVSEHWFPGSKSAQSRPTFGTNTVRFSQLYYQVELRGGAEANLAVTVLYVPNSLDNRGRGGLDRLILSLTFLHCCLDCHVFEP